MYCVENKAGKGHGSVGRWSPWAPSLGSVTGPSAKRVCVRMGWISLPEAFCPPCQRRKRVQQILSFFFLETIIFN